LSNPITVGDRSNVADADNAISANTQIIAEAACVAEAARVEQVKIETTGESSGEQPVAKGSTEAGVYGAVAAATGGSATVELAQMGVKAIGECLDNNNLGGMEKPVKAPPATPNRSIRTAFFNDIAGRSSSISDFMSGDDKVKGVQAETEISALKSVQQVQHALKAEATLHAGNAINHKAHLGAQAQQAQQMGMAPGGIMANGPTKPTFKDIEEETGTMA
jgi:hypothetical protein